MLYVYRRPKSEAANTLAEALEAARIRSIAGKSFSAADQIVCWGEHLLSAASLASTKILNGEQPLRSKFTDVELLTAARVPTIKARRSPGSGGEWLGRTTDHERGSDLLTPPRTPDFYVKKEDITKEFRVHIFKGLSIRAGEKVKSRADAHPWIRSWDSGWDMKYSGVTPTQRQLAKDAVKALKLDFGAVDLGLRSDGSLIVLEVNRAPALDEGNTAKVYAEAIREHFGLA